MAPPNQHTRHPSFGYPSTPLTNWNDPPSTTTTTTRDKNPALFASTGRPWSVFDSAARPALAKDAPESQDRPSLFSSSTGRRPPSTVDDLVRVDGRASFPDSTKSFGGSNIPAKRAALGGEAAAKKMEKEKEEEEEEDDSDDDGGDDDDSDIDSIFGDSTSKTAKDEDPPASFAQMPPTSNEVPNPFLRSSILSKSSLLAEWDENPWEKTSAPQPCGRCHHTVAESSSTIKGSECRCLRFMYNPLPSRACVAFSCDGCGHHASFHELKVKEDGNEVIMEDVDAQSGAEEGNQANFSETAKQDPNREYTSRKIKEMDDERAAGNPPEAIPGEDMAKDTTGTKAKGVEPDESIDRLERAAAKARACLFDSDGNTIAAREPPTTKYEENETRPEIDMEAEWIPLGYSKEQFEKEKERRRVYRKRWLPQADLPSDLDSTALTNTSESIAKNTAQDETMGGLEEGKDSKRKRADLASVDRMEAVEGAVYRMKESEGRKRGRVA